MTSTCPLVVLAYKKCKRLFFISPYQTNPNPHISHSQTRKVPIISNGVPLPVIPTFSLELSPHISCPLLQLVYSGKLCSLDKESHIYSADLPGMKKEEMKVEVEDSRYLIIRTEAIHETTKPVRNFTRKFRLPGRIDIDGISAGYEDGVLTVTVPRSFRRSGFSIDPADVPERLEVLARAA